MNKKKTSTNLTGGEKATATSVKSLPDDDLLHKKVMYYYQHGSGTTGHYNPEAEYSDQRTFSTLHHILCNVAPSVAVEYASKAPPGPRVFVKEGDGSSRRVKKKTVTDIGANQFFSRVYLSCPAPPVDRVRINQPKFERVYVDKEKQQVIGSTNSSRGGSSVLIDSSTNSNSSGDNDVDVPQATSTATTANALQPSGAAMHVEQVEAHESSARLTSDNFREVHGPARCELYVPTHTQLYEKVMWSDVEQEELLKLDRACQLSNDSSFVIFSPKTDTGDLDLALDAGGCVAADDRFQKTLVWVLRCLTHQVALAQEEVCDEFFRIAGFSRLKFEKRAYLMALAVKNNQKKVADLMDTLLHRVSRVVPVESSAIRKRRVGVEGFAYTMKAAQEDDSDITKVVTRDELRCEAGKKKEKDCMKRDEYFRYADFERVEGEETWTVPPSKSEKKLEKERFRRWFVFQLLRWNRYGTVAQACMRMLRAEGLGLFFVLGKLHKSYVDEATPEFESPKKDTHLQTVVLNYFVVLITRPADVMQRLQLRRSRPMSSAEVGFFFQTEYIFVRNLLRNLEQILDELFVMTGIDFDNQLDLQAQVLKTHIDILRRVALWALVVEKSILAWRCSFNGVAGGQNSHLDFLNQYESCTSSEAKKAEITKLLGTSVRLDRSDPGTISLQSLQKLLEKMNEQQQVKTVDDLVVWQPKPSTELVERQLGRWKLRQNDLHPKSQSTLDEEGGSWEYRICRDQDKQLFDDVVETNARLRTQHAERFSAVPAKQKKRSRGYRKFLEVWGRVQLTGDKEEKEKSGLKLWTQLSQKEKDQFASDEATENLQFYLRARRAREDHAPWNITQHDEAVLRREGALIYQRKYYAAVEAACVEYFTRCTSCRPIPSVERKRLANGEEITKGMLAKNWWKETEKEWSEVTTTSAKDEANTVRYKQKPPASRLAGILARFIMINRKQEKKLKSGLPVHLQLDDSSDEETKAVQRAKHAENLALEDERIPQLLGLVFLDTQKSYVITKIRKTPYEYCAVEVKFVDVSNATALDPPPFVVGGKSTPSNTTRDRASPDDADVDRIPTIDGLPDELLDEDYNAKSRGGYGRRAIIDDTAFVCENRNDVDRNTRPFRMFECCLTLIPEDPSIVGIEFMNQLEIGEKKELPEHLKKKRKAAPEGGAAKARAAPKAKRQKTENVAAVAEEIHLTKMKMKKASAGASASSVAAALASGSAGQVDAGEEPASMEVDGDALGPIARRLDTTGTAAAENDAESGQTVTRTYRLMPEPNPKAKAKARLLPEVGVHSETPGNVMDIRTAEEARRGAIERDEERNRLTSLIPRDMLPPGFDVAGDADGSRFRAVVPSNLVGHVQQLLDAGAALFTPGRLGVRTFTTKSKTELDERVAGCWCMLWAWRIFILITVSKRNPKVGTQKRAIQFVMKYEMKMYNFRKQVLGPWESQLSEEQKNMLDAVGKIENVSYKIAWNVLPLKYDKSGRAIYRQGGDSSPSSSNSSSSSSSSSSSASQDLDDDDQ
ncbi:unnamed protein product [Amoebophrya sp. A25]|nr:unnamed protein product [Amoebophrya sp. A25]|eukprot:GSA25T00027182001.1